MNKPLVVKMPDGTDRIVNEEQICYVSQSQNRKEVLLHMSDGSYMSILNPTWDQWMNDVLKRNSD